MSRPRSLAERVANINGVRIDGTFLRHASPSRDAFAGGYGARWGESFPVIYLARPAASCVEEAYRHLVDDTGVPANLVKPRTLYTVRIGISMVLDLRSAEAQANLGLDTAQLQSAVGDYEACQRIAAVAHQLEYHGIIAPAATGLGETLAVFRERATVDELPVVIEQEQWSHLPVRPGTEAVRFRVVPD